MKKILIALVILITLGLLIGGTFLFSGISSVKVSEEDFTKTLEPVSSYGLCDNEPGYPNPCGAS